MMGPGTDGSHPPEQTISISIYIYIYLYLYIYIINIIYIYTYFHKIVQDILVKQNDLAQN